MAGMLTVNEAADRYDEERAKNIGKVNEYARNFSEIADVVQPVGGGGRSDAMWLFMESLRTLAKKNLVKVRIKKGLADKFGMKQSKT